MSPVKISYTAISETLTVFFQSRSNNMFRYMVSTFLYILRVFCDVELPFYYYHSRSASSLLSKECLVYSFPNFFCTIQLFSLSCKAKNVSSRVMVCWEMDFWVLHINNANLNKSINKIRDLKCLFFLSHSVWMWGVYLLLFPMSCAQGIIVTWVVIKCP